MERDRHCVYVTDSPALGEVIVAYLAGQDIPAKLMDFSALGGIDGMGTLAGPGSPNEALQVWVYDESHLEEARRLMVEYDREQAERKQAHATETITAACEECGHVNTFSGTRRGGVEECVHCGAYIDVPNPGHEAAWPVDESADTSEPS